MQQIPLLLKLLIVLRVMIVNIPYLSYNSSFLLNAPIVVLILVFLISFLKKTEIQLGLILSIATLMIVDFLYGFVTGKESSLLTFLYGFMQFLAWPLIAIVIYSTKDVKFAKQLLGAILLSLSITGITTYIGCDLYPGAARDLASIYHENDQVKIELYNNLNIGGFEFVYTLMLICPLLVYYIRIKRWRKLSLCALIGALLVIIKTEYTTALLCFILSLMCFFIPRQNGARFVLRLFLGGVVAFFLLKALMGGILLWLSEMIDSETVSIRLQDIASLLNESLASSRDMDVEKRQELYAMDWEAFLKNPLFGNGYAKGGHSFVLGNLSKYGLIGLGLMMIVFKSIFKYSIRKYRITNIYPYILYCFALQLIIAFLNPMVIYMVFTFVIPLVACVENEHNPQIVSNNEH